MEPCGYGYSYLALTLTLTMTLTTPITIARVTDVMASITATHIISTTAIITTTITSRITNRITLSGPDCYYYHYHGPFGLSIPQIIARLPMKPGGLGDPLG